MSPFACRVLCPLFLLLILTSCVYRMPTENDYSVVPTTNNPANTRQKPAPAIPGLGY